MGRRITFALFLVGLFTGIIWVDRAHAVRVNLSAYVPTSCNVSLRSDFVQLSDNYFKIGSIDEDCNTQYELLFSYDASFTMGEFQLRGTSTSVLPYETSIIGSGKPYSVSSEVYLANVDSETARAIVNSLSVSVRSNGF